MNNRTPSSMKSMVKVRTKPEGRKPAKLFFILLSSSLFSWASSMLDQPLMKVFTQSSSNTTCHYLSPLKANSCGCCRVSKSPCTLKRSLSNVFLCPDLPHLWGSLIPRPTRSTWKRAWWHLAGFPVCVESVC